MLFSNTWMHYIQLAEHRLIRSKHTVVYNANKNKNVYKLILDSNVDVRTFTALLINVN